MRRVRADRGEDGALTGVGLSRRDLIHKIVAGTAFAIPAIASFDMSSLTVTAAEAYGPNQLAGPPRITSPDATTFAVGRAGTFTATTAPVMHVTPSIEESGQLPGGVTFSDNGDGTATLAGTPTVGSGGRYALTLTAADGFPPNATQAFVLTVQEAPTFTSPATAKLTTGQPGGIAIAASGYPPPSIAQAGALPAGVGFKADPADGTAVLAGEPAASGHGVYQLTLTASNGIGSAASQTLTLTVDEPIGFTSAPTATFKVGHAGHFKIAAAGFPAPSLKRSGQLPKGLKLTPGGDGSAVIAGTPAKGTQGRYQLKLTAAAPGLRSVSQKLTLTVVASPKPKHHG
jgi:hypothetical protein